MSWGSLKMTQLLGIHYTQFTHRVHVFTRVPA